MLSLQGSKDQKENLYNFLVPIILKPWEWLGWGCWFGRYKGTEHTDKNLMRTMEGLPI
jgi:hypothetical protein